MHITLTAKVYLSTTCIIHANHMHTYSTYTNIQMVTFTGYINMYTKPTHTVHVMYIIIITLMIQLVLYNTDQVL